MRYPGPISENRFLAQVQRWIPDQGFSPVRDEPRQEIQLNTGGTRALRMPVLGTALSPFYREGRKPEAENNKTDS